MNRFEQLIEYVINDEEQKARELFHDIVVAKSREIYESMMAEEAEEELDEAEEEEELDEAAEEELDEAEEELDEAAEEELDETDMGGDAADDLIDDVEMEEESDMSMEDEEIGGDDDGFGGDEGGEEAATKDDIMNLEDKLDESASYYAKPGDMVIVASLNGEFREGIILGSIIHPSRKSTLDPEKGPQYINEFNGVETYINETGEYKLTFKGLQKNINKLKEKPGQNIEIAQYDDAVGGSYFQLDKTGSFLLIDSAKEQPQSIKLDKPNGSITIQSGNIVITMTKKDEKVSLKSKVLSINSETSISQTTKDPYSFDFLKDLSDCDKWALVHEGRPSNTDWLYLVPNK